MNNDIDNFLNKLNWKFERLNDTMIVSGFTGNTTSFTFYISDADEWIIFLTYANLLPIPEKNRSEIFSILTKLNYETPFVKFSIDGKSNIVVLVELPNKLLTETSVQISLDSLCTYTEIVYDLLPDYHVIMESGV